MGFFSDAWDGVISFFGDDSSSGTSGYNNNVTTGSLLDSGMMDTGSSVASQGTSDWDLGVSFDYEDLFKEEEDKGFLEGIEGFAKENPKSSKALMTGLGMLGQYFAQSSIADKQIEGREDLIKLQAALNKATTGTAGSPGVLRRKSGKVTRTSKKDKKEPKSLLE